MGGRARRNAPAARRAGDDRQRELHEALSSRHVPNDIFQVDEIPRTLTGKKLELPVKKLLLGKPLAAVVNPDAVANPQSLDYFVEFAKRFTGDSAV